MRIVHRVSLSSSASLSAELATLGVPLPNEGFQTFLIDESDARWERVRAWIEARGAFDFVTTEFSKGEIDRARVLEVGATWHHGYPQPEDDFGYRALVYDLTDWCPQCGQGLIQRAPFQMRGEPKWGRRGILPLNWVFDEFFAKPEIWQSIFEPVGVRMLPVTNRKGKTLSTVVQLVVESLIPIDTEGLPFAQCPGCARPKYLPVRRGPSQGP